MGVDISGRNPVFNTPKPGEPDWDTCSDEERDNYYTLLSEWQEKNPGDYFRASWWSWRPIVALISLASAKHNLSIDTKPYNYNDGDGLKTQKECDELADALQEILGSYRDFKEDDSRIYLCLGSWVDLNGRLVRDEREAKLNESHPLGTVLNSPLVDSDGDIVMPSHSADKSHILEFIAFLRNCGGFQIW